MQVTFVYSIYLVLQVTGILGTSRRVLAGPARLKQAWKRHPKQPMEGKWKAASSNSLYIAPTPVDHSRHCLKDMHVLNAKLPLCWLITSQGEGLKELMSGIRRPVGISGTAHTFARKLCSCAAAACLEGRLLRRPPRHRVRRAASVQGFVPGSSGEH